MPAISDPAELPEGLGRIFDKAVDLSKDALLQGVQESFALARAYYSMIDLPAMVASFPQEYTTEELDAIEADVRGPAEVLAN